MAKKFRIAVIPGDGTGPEVTGEALKALDASSQKAGFSIEKECFDLGGERFLRTGEVLPEGTIDELKKYDAILLGAVGHPDVKPGILEKGLLLALRFGLDQYINLRPVILYPGVETPLRDKGPEDINFVVVRENTEGLYSGAGGFLRKGTPQEVAVQESVNTRFGVERCIRFAFDLCRKRNYCRKLTLCGKTNVLTYAFDLWERTFNEVAGEYPDVATDYAHVDAICMWMIKNPECFDVIVTDNMFGDIITDIGAMIQGGMGIAAGGNVNPDGVSMFEPIGGSAPKYAGLNIINPLAAIAAAQMMLEHLGEAGAAGLIENAIRKVVSSDLKSLSAGRMGHSTQEVGDMVVKYINQQ
jgi:3-isopropylmalate dehydrogenase